MITQNIDGLDGKAGNKNYIAIHGRLDQMTLFHHQGDDVQTMQTPWDDVDEDNLIPSLLNIFNIDSKTKRPILNESFKPYVLLFDEFYTELYRISEAQERMRTADKIIFMGTSFSVNITQMALRTAVNNGIPIEVVDPQPIELPYSNVTYHKMKASKYIQLI